MGSIQALRSEALAGRSRDDTALQVSGYMGTVNKSLGSQVLNMIDQLQGTVVERTKAYNKSIAGLKQKLEKRNGANDSMVALGFSLVNGFIQNVLTISSAVPIGIKIAKGDGESSDFVALVAKAVSLVASIAGTLSSIDAVKYNIKSAVFDYEKAMSQLGMMDKVPNQVNGAPSPASAGAARLLDKRDSLMPRYKPKDKNYIQSTSGPGGGYNGTHSTKPYTTDGYVGTLRRV